MYRHDYGVVSQRGCCCCRNSRPCFALGERANVRAGCSRGADLLVRQRRRAQILDAGRERLERMVLQRLQKWQDWPVVGSGPLPGFRVVLLTEGGLLVIIWRAPGQ